MKDEKLIGDIDEISQGALKHSCFLMLRVINLSHAIIK